MDVGLQKYCRVGMVWAKEKGLHLWIEISLVLWFTAKAGALVMAPDSSDEEAYGSGAGETSGARAKTRAGEKSGAGAGAVLVVWVLCRCGVGGR